MCLRDDAQVTLSDLKPQERKNFKSIVTALTSRFEPEDQSDLFRSELKSRFGKKDEPLTEFAQDIKCLVGLAYPNTDVDVRATLGRNAFEDSIGDPDMEWAVHQGKPKSIETAVKLALEFEAFRGSRKQLNPPRLNKEPMRVQTEEPILENKTNNNSQNRMRDPPRNQRLYTYCARRGHLEHECFTKKKALEPGKLLEAGEGGRSPATENRPESNRDDYRIMGYFRVAKFSRFCLKNMRIIFRGF